MSFHINSVIMDGKELLLSRNGLAQGGANKFTVILGRNGLGKSRLLSSIARTFLAVNSNGNIVARDRSPYGMSHTRISEFSVSYLLNGESCFLHVKNGRVSSFDDDPAIPYGLVPSKVIATSTSPFDKFPIGYGRERETNKNNIYVYLGAKNRSGLGALNEQVERVVDSILREGIPCFGLDHFERIFDFLGFKPRLSLLFRMRYSEGRIISMLDNHDSLNYRLPRIQQLMQRLSGDDAEFIKNEITESLMVVRDFSAHRRFHDDASSGRYIDFDISFDGSDLCDVRDVYRRTEILRQYGLIELIGCGAHKKSGESIALWDMSSGEQCVLIMLLGIASEISDGSLICIDEPEISLHPAWQESFIELLQHTFSNYSNCHFLIATHSPQLVSKLSADNCYILTMEDNELHSSVDYANKSADFQLAKLFGAPGSGNEYLNRESVSLLSRVSANRGFDAADLQKAKELIDFLPSLDDGDHVARLINVIKKAAEANT